MVTNFGKQGRMKLNGMNFRPILFSFVGFVFHPKSVNEAFNRQSLGSIYE
jgi:hypothetical protein